MRYSNSRVFILMLIVISTVMIDVSWKVYAEQSARQVARYSAENIRSCVNDIVLGKNQNAYRNVSNAELEVALKTCAQKARVTETGDVFAVDLRTLDFVFDPSLDCYVEGGKKMTVESECTLHKDQEMCREIIPVAMSGYDSTNHTNAWWKFNTSREYLEWVVVPDETRGFDGFVGGGVLKPHQLVIVQGVIEDELWASYKGFRVALYLIGFLSIMINLLYAVHENLKHEREHLSRSPCDTERVH